MFPSDTQKSTLEQRNANNFNLKKNFVRCKKSPSIFKQLSLFKTRYKPLRCSKREQQRSRCGFRGQGRKVQLPRIFNLFQSVRRRFVQDVFASQRHDASENCEPSACAKSWVAFEKSNCSDDFSV